MRLIFKCSSSDENYSGGCDYAEVHVDQHHAAALLEKIKLLKQIREWQNNDNLYMMEYWWQAGPDCVYFSPYIDEEADCAEADAGPNHAEVAEQLDKTLATSFPLWDVLMAPADLPAITSDFMARTEYETMIVRDDGIQFSCYPKHGDCLITTTEISVELLKEIAGV